MGFLRKIYTDALYYLRRDQLRAAIDGQDFPLLNLEIAAGIDLDRPLAADKPPPLLYHATYALEAGGSIVKLLLGAGADPNVTQPEAATPYVPPKKLGKTRPLHIAVDCNNPDAVEALLKGGAKPDALDEYGSTPLLLALDDIIEYGHDHATLQVLLDGKTDPNQVVERGRLLHPLHYVADRELSGVIPVSVVKILLQAGADPRAPDEYGWTSIDLAEIRLSRATADNNQSAIEYSQCLIAEFQNAARRLDQAKVLVRRDTNPGFSWSI